MNEATKLRGFVIARFMWISLKAGSAIIVLCCIGDFGTLFLLRNYDLWS